MRSWRTPRLPEPPGNLPPLRLFDSASGRLQECGTGRHASMYVCGITPYDATHLGHAATYVTFDLIHRYWLASGRIVDYVQNLTDIDDPLLERAFSSGEDWRELAERETELFRSDMQALRILPPRWYVGAVESIPAITATISQLEALGATYRVGQDIYYDTSCDPGFGQLNGLPASQMLVLDRERGGDPDRPGKRNALDPVLWRTGTDEPAWDSPLGPGRPGWHIECAAIATEFLGVPIDVQGGGGDLAFPHHEMSASLAKVSEAEQRFARCYVHVGMVGYQGAKMSKSLGNLVLVKDQVSAGVDPMAVRLALLGQQYRETWEWSPRLLAQAQRRLTRWRQAFDADAAAPVSDVISELLDALSTDLDTPAALAAVDRWVDASATGAAVPGAARRLADSVDLLLGVK